MKIKKMIVSFDCDTRPELIYEAFRSLVTGFPTKEIAVNGMVPTVDNLGCILKMAKNNTIILLKGYFNPRTLKEACLEELIVITKYLAGLFPDRFGIIFEYYENCQGYEMQTIDRQYAVLTEAFKNSRLSKDAFDRLIWNKCLL